MKKALLFAAVVSLSAFTSFSANAQFGGLPGVGAKTGSSSSASAGDVDAFLKTADEADGLIRKSASTLFSAVATKQQIDAQEDVLKAANAVADPKEKEAAIKKASDDQLAQLAKVDYAAKSEEMKKSMDAKKSKQIGASIYNFTLGMLKDKEVMDKGQGVIASISSNPMAAGKLVKAKDVVSSVTGQMGSISTIAVGIQKLMTVAKLEALPTKTTDQPKPFAD